MLLYSYLFIFFLPARIPKELYFNKKTFCETRGKCAKVYSKKQMNYETRKPRMLNDKCLLYTYLFEMYTYKKNSLQVYTKKSITTKILLLY